MSVFRKKLTRKQLLNQPDELLTLGGRAGRYFEEHSYTVILGTALVILIIAGVFGYRFYRSYQISAANLLENAAYNDYHGQVKGEGDPQQNPNVPLFATRKEMYQSALNKYQDLINKYPGAPNAKRAKFYIANCHYNLEEYDKAAQIYQEIISQTPKDDPFYQQALQSLAYVQEGMKKYPEAAQTFQELIDLTPDEFDKMPLYLEQARILSQNNEWEKAADVYETMLKNTKVESQQALIKSRLAEAKAKLNK